MSRDNNYKIEIFFENKDTNSIFIDDIPYISSKSYTDRINISSNNIVIDASRCSKIKLESIFFNHNSSLYNQIIKVLIFYYSTVKKFIEINEIIVERSRKMKVLETLRIKNKELRKILSTVFLMKFEISKDKLKSIFNEDKKGKALFVATSYLLKANSTDEPGDKFDELWKSFNSIYKIIGKKNKDFDNLKELKKFLLSYGEYLQNSLFVTKDINSEKLRKKLRWRALILNDYNTEKKN